jgi:hypothetical protein
MFDLGAALDDDRDFLDLATRLIAGAAKVHGPEDVLIYKIDNWFDHKWLGFSGKVLAAIGVWSSPLTLPPFVANRVVRRWHYRRDEVGDGYRVQVSPPDVHHRGWTARNLQRRVRQVVPDSALFWFSGNTAATGRGSLMAYAPVDPDLWPWSPDPEGPAGASSKSIPVDPDLWPWFLAFVRDPKWKVAHRKNIHAYEVRSFEEAAERVHQGEKGLPD